MGMGQIDSLKSPRFSGIATFARLPHTRNLNGIDVAFLGIPFDDATTFRPGARFGPRAVRETSCLLHPYNPLLDIKPFDVLNVTDWGDVDVVPGYIEDTYKKIEEGIEEISQTSFPLICGGDHSITLPVLRVLYKKYGRLSCCIWMPMPIVVMITSGESIIMEHPSAGRGRKDFLT